MPHDKTGITAKSDLRTHEQASIIIQPVSAFPTVIQCTCTLNNFREVLNGLVHLQLISYKSY